MAQVVPTEIPAVTYLLGPETFRVEGDVIYDSQGEPLKLRAKSLQFLLFLLRSSGKVVSKSELAEGVWPGLVVTDESISQCATEIRRLLADQDHSILETFPKRGYRLNAEITQPDEPAGKPWIVVCSVFGLALVLGASLWLYTRSVSPPPALREVVAVLPFSDTGASEASSLIAEGLAQDIIVRLAEVSDIQVLPSSLTSTVTEDGLQAIGAAKSLGARFVVDGKLTFDEGHLGISVELIDGRDETISWAGAFDGASSQLVEFRDQIIEQVATSINQSIPDKELERIRTAGTQDPVAYQELLLGRLAVSQFTREASYQAEKHFRKAIEHDPDHARAYAELAAVFAIRIENGWTVLTQADENKALFFADKALMLDPDLWFAHYALGRLHSVFQEKDYQKSEYHLERAMALQPANDDPRVYYGAVKYFQGKPEEAVAIVASVIASHPNPPFWYYLSLGNALLILEDYEAAEQALDQCLLQMPSSPYCLRFQIANYAKMGRIEDAEWLVAEYEMLGFEPSVSAIMSLLLDSSPEQRSWLEEALRAAGLPD